MAGSAAALTGGALLAVYGMDRAHTTPESPTDVDILNYALTLEHLEANFHVQGLRRFGEQDFRSSNLFRGSSNLPRPTVYANFKRIRDHEFEHVTTLKGVIRSLGGTPVPACATTSTRPPLPASRSSSPSRSSSRTRGYPHTTAQWPT